MLDEQQFRITYLTGKKRFLSLCVVKMSYDGGQTWWPPGPHALHIAGDVYALLADGRYAWLNENERRSVRL